MIFGNLAALPQNNFKRLLAYSSIGHAGYLLTAVASVEGAHSAFGSVGTTVGFYLFAYLLMTLLGFLALTLVSTQSRGDDIQHFNGLSKRSPFVAFCLLISMASLAGIPLTAGFYGKFLVFSQAVNAKQWPLIGMGLMGGGVWGVGYAIVDMRIRQVLKRFMGTPMKKPHFVAAMMFSRMIFMIPEIIVVLLVSRFFFGVTNHGSYLNVMLLIVLGAFEFAGIGLLIASRAKTLEAVSGLMNLAMVPMWIGSGIFFSAKRFPEFVQPVIGLLPLTPLISALRQVMQEGAGTIAILPEITVISAWGVLTFAVAIRIFRWE
jgi:NADH:ubiquinone oxidoreductase subunit 5 (subunit L)/multisubunit Na+/H+ antiporter MnhA subunit